MPVAALVALCVLLVCMFVFVFVLFARAFAHMCAPFRADRPQAGDQERLERIWSELRPLLVAGHPVPTVVLRDAPTSTSLCIPGRRPRLVIRRGLLEQPSAEALRGELGHEYSHTFKPPTATVVVVALAALLLAEFATLMITASPHAPLRAISLVISWVVTAAGTNVLILWLSRREELRADRHAARLLGSAEPVIAMLEQVQADSRALGVDADRGRLSDRLFATHPPVEARIRALSRPPEHSRAGSAPVGARPRTGSEPPQ